MTLRPTTRPIRRAATASAAVLAAGVLAACATPAAGPAAPATTSAPAQPHGYVEGAAELAEPQHLLAAVDAAGAVRLLDPLTEEVRELGQVGAAEHVADDGRFLAITTADGVTIVDAGVWRVDHGDHAHHYRAEPRVVGALDLAGPVVLRATESAVAVLAGDAAILLDRAALGQGEIVETGRIEGLAPGGFAAPAAGGAVVATPDAVEVRGADGAVRAALPCAEPEGGVVTRVGAAVGCAEGVVLAVEGDAGVELERVDLPAGTDASLRPSGFDLRPGRATAAAIAGDAGYWLLDTRERTWTLVETEAPIVRVAAVDDAEGHVVGVDADGRVVVHDGEGARIGATEPVLAASLADPEVAAALALEVDADRAYVPLAADDAVLEIDYADAARIARTLAVPAPLHLVEAGR